MKWIPVTCILFILSAISSAQQLTLLRIYAKGPGISDIKIIVDPDTLNFNSNITNKEAFIFPALVATFPIKIEFKVNGISDQINCTTGTVSAFIQALNNKNLGVEALSSDPALFNCVSSGTPINIQISYGFKSNSTANEDRRSFTARCYIDNEGVISLPRFYQQNINPNTDDAPPGYFDLWLDATKNSSRFKLINEGNCDFRNCITRFEAEKRITSFYVSRIGNQTYLFDINVTIIPSEEEQAITVIYKGKKIILPYTPEQVHKFLSSDLNRKKINIRKKCMKITLFSRCNIQAPKTATYYKFRSNRSYTTTFKTLLPGDLIFIK